MTLREKLFNAIWRCGFAPDEDPQLVEIKKLDWPDDVARVEKRADAALSVLRQWLDAERLVCVPRDPSDAMAEAGWSVRGTQFEPTPDAQEIYRAMISAAPDALETKP